MIPSDDPGHDWDVYCAEQEAAYAARIEGKTCGDCGRCEKSPDENTDWGFCLDVSEFVLLEESVEDIECEAFEE